MILRHPLYLIFKYDVLFCTIIEGTVQLLEYKTGWWLMREELGEMEWLLPNMVVVERIKN